MFFDSRIKIKKIMLLQRLRYSILFFLSITTFSFAQELKDAEIETVSVKSKPKIATILKRLNKQLLKKTDTTSFVFDLSQINLKIIFISLSQKRVLLVSHKF